jgi:Tol biopolymer transport system component
MKRRVLAALLTTGLLGPASALAVPDGGIELVDRPSGFGPLPFDGINEASVDRHAMSDNGCFVVIESDNDVLSALDDDDDGDIFRVNRCVPGHPAELVSTTPAGVPADGDSFSPSISADGKKIAFTTTARNLLPPGTTVNHAIVVKDMDTGAVTVASRGADPGGAVAEAFQGIISGDGNAVAFRGRGAIEASNATGVADQEDIYVRYLVGGDTRMASVIDMTTTPGGADGAFDVGYDGTAVALITQGALDPTDSDGENSAYLVRNLVGTPKPIKASGAQEPRYVALSGDATRVAFIDNRVWMSICNPTTCGAPAAQDGAAPTGDVSTFGVGFPAGSGAPTHLFWSTNRALIAGDTDTETDFYILDLGPGANLFRAPHHAGGVFGGDFDPGDASVFNAVDPALPGTDGVRPQVFVYDDGGNTTLISLPDGETRRGETYNTSVDRRHAVSESGRFVVMSTDSPGLGAPSPAPGRFWLGQIIVRDVAGGVTTNASAGAGGAPADRYADTPTIDAPGDRVAFESAATNLVPGATGNDLHVYVRDLATGATQRIDRKADGGAAAGGAHDAVLSGDGTKVAFISGSPDLPDADTHEHAYLVDLATGSIVLVDRTADGAVGDNDAREVDVSADGSRVAFISAAQNLGGFATAQYRVFVKDMGSGAVTFASPPESGTPSVAAQALTFSGDGSHVGWVEEDPGFGYGSDGQQHVFVRDLSTAATTLASAGGPAAAGAFEREGELDRTGTHLAFLRSVPGLASRPLLRDLTSGTTTELLPGRRSPGFGLSISPDGHCVAVNSNSPDVLATGNPSPDFDHVYLMGVGAACPPVLPSGGPGGTKDTTPPVITRLRMTRKRFAVAKKRTALVARRAKRGSAFLFTLSENARTSIAIARALPGRRSGKRCVKPRKRLKRRCKRYVVVRTLTRTKTKKGPNRVAFTGRIGARKLKPGRYRATVGAVDAAGNRAVPKRVTFRIVRR